MPTAENAASTLNIHRFRSMYLVPHDHPAPDAVRSKLDHVVEHKFKNAIATALSHALPDSTAGVWLIRSLTLDVDLNLDAGEDQVAESWAKQAAISVARILQENAEADQVLHFSSAAAHLAHFLRDLADGSAWEKWYYRKFEGMRHLPLSAALRTAICRDPSTGLEALQQMNESAVRRVLSALNEHDAKHILNEIAREDRLQQLDLAQLNPHSALQYAFDGEHRSALHLYLRLSKQHPQAAGSQLKSTAVSLVCLARCLRDAPQQTALINILACGDAVALFQSLAPSDAERLLPLLGAPVDWLQSIAQAQFPSSASIPSEETRHTAAGGVFLLLPLLDAMPIDAATQHWPALNDCAPASIVRWIILMRCFGNAGAALVFHDPLVRDLLRISPQIDASSLKTWQRALTRRQLLDFQNQIALWQIDSSIATEFSISAFATGSKPQSLLCCEQQHRSLLLALPDSPSSPTLLLNAINAWLALADSTNIPVADEHQLAGTPLAEADLQALLRDLEFLRLPTALRSSQRSELTFSVAARALLRNFSGRLMGFSQSGLEYLFVNFLDIPASMQTSSGQSIVRLGQPPLHVVLSLAGMNRQSYTLSWSPGTFTLFPDSP
jgi:hypothetical protein